MSTETVIMGYIAKEQTSTEVEVVCTYMTAIAVILHALVADRVVSLATLAGDSDGSEEGGKDNGEPHGERVGLLESYCRAK